MQHINYQNRDVAEFMDIFDIDDKVIWKIITMQFLFFIVTEIM